MENIKLYRWQSSLNKFLNAFIKKAARFEQVKIMPSKILLPFQLMRQVTNGENLAYLSDLILQGVFLEPAKYSLYMFFSPIYKMTFVNLLTFQGFRFGSICHTVCPIQGLVVESANWEVLLQVNQEPNLSTFLFCPILCHVNQINVPSTVHLNN